jgi:hypothetical protein
MPRASWLRVTILHLSDELLRDSMGPLHIPLSPSPYYSQLQHYMSMEVTYMQENHGRLVRFFWSDF